MVATKELEVAADQVAQNKEIGQASSGKPARAYYIENIASHGASAGTPTGLASYVDGWKFSGSEGDLIITYASGAGSDAIANAAGAPWAAVIEDDNGNYHFNVVLDVTGNDITLLFPIKADITAGSVHPKHDSVSGQHLTDAGNRAYAQHAVEYSVRLAAADQAVYLLKHGDLMNPSPWSGGSNVLAWRPIGGLPENKTNSDRTLNQFDASEQWNAVNKETFSLTCDLAGEGAELKIRLNNTTGFFRTTCGIAGTDLSATGQIEVFADGVSIYSATFGKTVKEFVVPVNGANELICQVTRTDAGVTEQEFRIGQTDVVLTSGAYPKVVDLNAKILLLGDSWFDYSRPGFQDQLEDLITAKSASGTVSNRGVGGMTSRYGLSWLQHWIDADKPNYCLINFFTNDNNDLSGQTYVDPDGVTQDLDVVDHAEWVSNIRELASICIDNGVTPVVMLPSLTSSDAQAQTHGDMAVLMRAPTLVKEWQDSATDNEFSNDSTRINLTGKYPGRLVRKANDNKLVISTGFNPTDAWVYSDGTTYVTPS